MMENQREKQMEDDMATSITEWLMALRLVRDSLDYKSVRCLPGNPKP